MTHINSILPAAVLIQEGEFERRDYVGTLDAITKHNIVECQFQCGFMGGNVGLSWVSGF